MDKRENARRRARRAARARKQRNRRILLTVALVLVVALASIGGTLAWLVDKTDPVANTFTSAGIDIDLTETKQSDGENMGENESWTAQMIPGYSYTKNPKVTVESTTNVDVWLFVKFEESNNPSTYLTYTSTLTEANGWTQGDGTNIPSNVWYRKVKTTDTTKSWELLSGNTISVKDAVTKDNMSTAASATLTYTAYASQLYKSAGVEFSAKEAWDNVKPST